MQYLQCALASPVVRGKTLALCSAVLLCTQVFVLGSGCEEEAVAQNPLVEVTQGPLTYVGSYYGELKAKESITIHAPELTGVQFLTIDTILDDGIRVKKDDVILTFVREPLEDELLSEETELAVAKASYKRLEHNLDKEQIDLQLDVKRKKMSVERAELFVVEGVNLISKLELEKFKLDVDGAKLEHNLARQALQAFRKKRATSLEVERLKVEAAQRQVDDKKKNLENMEIYAPADGVIYGPYTRLNWVRGKAVPGSVCRPGDKLLEIPDLKKFEAHIHVRQRDAALINPGSTATVYPTSQPDRAINAVVKRKEDFATTRNERMGTKSPEGNLKEILVVLELEDSLDTMRPGGTVRADLEATLVEDTTLVPLAALEEVDTGLHQVVMEDGQSREIKLGTTSTTHAQVSEGLAPGDKVQLQ